MGDADKKPRRDIYKRPWYPRDGEPILPEIPEHVREQLIKERERSGSGRYTLARFVGVRGREYGFELPDYPDAATVWVDLAARADGKGE